MIDRNVSFTAPYNPTIPREFVQVGAFPFKQDIGITFDRTRCDKLRVHLLDEDSDVMTRRMS
jgi:hypothetical protein